MIYNRAETPRRERGCKRAAGGRNASSKDVSFSRCFPTPFVSSSWDEVEHSRCILKKGSYAIKVLVPNFWRPALVYRSTPVDLPSAIMTQPSVHPRPPRQPCLKPKPWDFWPGCWRHFSPMGVFATLCLIRRCTLASCRLLPRLERRSSHRGAKQLAWLDAAVRQRRRSAPKLIHHLCRHGAHRGLWGTSCAYRLGGPIVTMIRRHRRAAFRSFPAPRPHSSNGVGIWRGDPGPAVLRAAAELRA